MIITDKKTALTLAINLSTASQKWEADNSNRRYRHLSA